MITLRDFTLSDADRLADLANNENVSRYLICTFPFPYTKTDAEWWIKIGSKANNSITKVVQYEGAFVGTVGITPQTGWKAHSAEIGYWIGEEFWNKGLATEALKVMSEFAFLAMNFKKLFATVLGPNKASMRVLEKCGYSLEGVLKRMLLRAAIILMGITMPIFAHRISVSGGNWRIVRQLLVCNNIIIVIVK